MKDPKEEDDIIKGMIQEVIKIMVVMKNKTNEGGIILKIGANM